MEVYSRLRESCQFGRELSWVCGTEMQYDWSLGYKEKVVRYEAVQVDRCQLKELKLF